MAAVREGALGEVRGSHGVLGGRAVVRAGLLG